MQSITKVRERLLIGALTMALCLLGATWAYAVPIIPSSYDMINGGSGRYTYHDDKYNGTGDNTQDYVELSDGLGDLTDGIAAAGNWYEDPAAYVGWTANVTITFSFATKLDVDAIGIHVDDAGGSGGVALPASVGIDLGGSVLSFNIDDDADSDPNWLYFENLGITDGRQIKLTLDRSASWVFLSEVTFDGSPVPEPASLLLLSVGILGLAVMRKRRS